MCDLINILSIIDDKTQLINFPKLDPNSFKPAVLALIQRLKDTVASVKASDKEPTWDTLVTPIEDASENLSCLVGCRTFEQRGRYARVESYD